MVSREDFVPWSTQGLLPDKNFFKFRSCNIVTFKFYLTSSTKDPTKDTVYSTLRDPTPPSEYSTEPGTSLQNEMSVGVQITLRVIQSMSERWPRFKWIRGKPYSSFPPGWKSSGSGWKRLGPVTSFDYRTGRVGRTPGHQSYSVKRRPEW